MDFTGMTMSDHYRAIAQERERQIAGSAWRRKLDEARRENTAACCAAYDEATPSRALPARRPAAGTR